ncbi:hypothetical protein CDL15_Pgr015814 [Punica granatum]|nr:hypothetical protein CDL15_Pgr015814 [Punica granatum]PKI53249.1 hypothetical protein CRG98_026381 [Punica granatum]
MDGSIGNLKSLKHLNLKNCKSLRGLPEEIGYLEALQELFLRGSAYPFAPLPESIGNLGSLVILEVWGVSVARLPDTIGRLRKLKRLSLENTKIERLPDSIGRLKKLEYLSLGGCSEIQKLPDSFGDLQSLSTLNISSTGLLELPNSIGNLEELKELNASWSRLQGEIPTEIGKLSRLRGLNLNMSKIRLLPSTISQLSSLKSLLLWECNNLEELPRLPASLTRISCQSEMLKRIPDDLSNMKNLTDVVLSNPGERRPLGFNLDILPGHNVKELTDCSTFRPCSPSHWYPVGAKKCIIVRIPDIRTLPTGLLDSVSQLSTLILGCPNLLWIPQLPSSLSTLVLEHLREDAKLPCLSNLKNLSYLIFFKCSIGKDGFESLGVGELEKLETLVLQFDFSMLDGLRVPGSLQMLDLTDCTCVQKLPDLSHLESLKVLKIAACEALLELPDLGGLVSLQGLFIFACKSLKSIGHRLPLSLRTLCLNSCISLEKLPDLSRLMFLQVLELEECKELVVVQGLGFLVFLEVLSIVSCKSLKWLWPQSPAGWGNVKWPLLNNLQELRIHNCDRVVEISGLGELDSLRKLDISSCGSLKELGPNLPALEVLEINSCPNLKQLPHIPSMMNLRRVTIRGCDQLGVSGSWTAESG